MSPIKISAEFAAFVWYCHGKPETPEVQKEARRFARRNWREFIPNAHKGLGRLLIKIAQGRPATAEPRTEAKHPSYRYQDEPVSACS
jgi:hypothetical protein